MARRLPDPPDRGAGPRAARMAGRSCRSGDSMTGKGPLHLHSTRVIPDWVDYNGHLSEAYYVLIYGHATDALLDAVGMDESFRTRTGRSVYTVDARIRYLSEVACGEDVEVRTWIAGADPMRMLVHHAM